MSSRKRMDGAAAVRYLHERHPRVVEPPGDEVTLGDLHLEVFWLMGHAYDSMEEREGRELRQYFKSMDLLLRRGDRDVLAAVFESFLQHLVFDPGIEWARRFMPQTLLRASNAVEVELKKQRRRTP